MTTEEVSKRPGLRSAREERERELRRMRDRQRRQSMSVEAREKHLARRRRNYQLRRQRTEKAHLDSEDEHIRIASSGAVNSENENPALSVVSKGAKTVAYKSAKAPTRLRLHQIRHLARLLNTPKVESKSGSQRSEEGVINRDGVTRNCRSRKRIRLVHVKCLARALNSRIKENADQTS